MRNIKKLVVPSLILAAVATGMGYVGLKTAYQINQSRTSEFVKDGEFEGYNVSLGVDVARGDRCIGITDSNSDAHIFAIDYKSNGLGRFDEINLETIPQGHPLERLANLTDLERVYEAVKPESK